MWRAPPWLHSRSMFVIVVNKYSSTAGRTDDRTLLPRHRHDPLRGPDSDNPLAFRWYDRRPGGAPARTMEEHLRFAVCYWHSFNWPGIDIFGARHPRPAVARTRSRPHGGRAREDGCRPSSSSPSSVCRSTASTTATSRPRAIDLRRVVPQLRRDGRRCRRAIGAHRRPAVVGDGQPVLAPTVPGGRGDQSRPRGVRLRRRAGGALHRGHPPARRRELRAVGRPRGLRDAAQHRHGAASSTSSAASSHGRRAQARHRLRGHDPASNRSRSSPPSTSTTTTSPPCTRFLQRYGLGRRGQGQHRGQPRHARRPRLRPRDRRRRSPRASSDRSTPTPATTASAGTSTSSRSRSSR